MQEIIGIILAALLGGVGYAIRGGHVPFTDKLDSWGTQAKRMFFVLPFTALPALFINASDTMVYKWAETSFTDVPTEPLFWFTYFLLVFLVTILGHGEFMDMGRYLGLNKGSPVGRHQFPVTYMIGREDRRWSFWKRWVHNAVGMSIIGMMRHSVIFLFLGAISFWWALGYTLLGILHSILYEAGYWLATMGKEVSAHQENKKITISEYLVGFLMVGSMVAILFAK